MTKNLQDHIHDTAVEKVQNGTLSESTLNRMERRANRTLSETGSLESREVHEGLSAALDTVRKPK
jgi:hypothetical protein